MSRAMTRQLGSVALLVAVGAGFPFFAADAEAGQRTFVPADGTDCLVVTGAAPVDAPRVLGGRQPLREEFGENDHLFIGGPGISDFEVGQTLQFVRGYGKVRHPDTNAVIAEAIGWLGFAEVVEVGADRALVRVVKSCREIEIGEFLVEPDLRPVANVDNVPPFDPRHLITPDPTDASVILGELESVLSEEGERRTGTAPREAYGQRDVVIIDQGTTSGWSAGDIVTMYRDKLRISTATSVTVETYTPVILAVGLVVATGDEASAVLIVEGDFDVSIGDRVRRDGAAGS